MIFDGRLIGGANINDAVNPQFKTRYSIRCTCSRCGGCDLNSRSNRDLSNLAPWYAGLVKPSFNPPNWIFAPVWTTLYALMAFALWRILRVRMPSSMHRRYMVGLFFLLLALNAAWSWMFFWAHSPLLGLINIVPQLGVVIATVVSFARVDRLAAFCLLPLAAWVAFAGCLTLQSGC